VRRVSLKSGADLDGFRAALRSLVADGVRPHEVIWDAAPSLFQTETTDEGPPVIVPRGIAQRIALLVCHRDPERYGLLHQLVWRMRHGERALPEIASDPLVHRLHGMEKSVRRDLHKMHAFVRFRKAVAEEEHFVAWFEPEHFIIEATAQFFVDRFRGMRWSILTPVGSLHWDRTALTIGPAAVKTDAPTGDGFEAGWRSYYESTFNPARLNPDVMRGHMAKKYWKNLPEAESIPDLIRSAPSRVRQMIEQEQAMPRNRDPKKAVAAMADQAPRSLAALNQLIAAAAPMVKGGTRAVLGEGPLQAPIAFVGEQPGDQEDIAGKPFVGPAGKLLDAAMREAGIDRHTVYVTNAVKHFKFEQRGKRRIHSKPTAGEVKHYRWWLEKELDLVKPGLVVALGATAAMALAGKPLAVGANRGPVLLDGRSSFITIHPSFLLRMPQEDKALAWKQFVADLHAVRSISQHQPRAA
jgi:probable DNA metabolism protein